MNTVQLYAVFLVWFQLTEDGQAEDSVADLVEDFFDFRLRESPAYATYYGLPFYQSDVEEWGEEAFRRRLTLAQSFKDRANDLNSKTIRDKQEMLDLKILKAILDTYISGSEYSKFVSGFNGELLNIANQMKLANIDSEEKLGHWYQRVIKYTSLVRNQAQEIPRVINSSYVLPCVSVVSYHETLQRMLSDSVENFFAFEPWKTLNISTTNQTFYNEGKSKCGHLLAALQNWSEALMNYSISGCRGTIGVSGLPDGANFYRAAIRFHTSEDMTPEKIHQLGLDESNRIADETNEIAKRAGFRSMRDYVNHMMNQTEKTFATPDAVIQAFSDAYQNAILPKMASIFHSYKIGPIQMVNAPGGLGRYTAPSLDGSRPAVFQSDVSRPREFLRVNVLPLTLHETVPGHHLHTTVSIQSGMKKFRRLTDWRHYAQVPFTWPFFTAWSEGWSLYAEYLGEEMNLYSSDEDRLGKLSFESLRAVRLVVDTGIHYYNWSLNTAVQYMMERTTLSQHECQNQIIRYINWPGQACAYKVGELKIKALRKKAQEQLGHKFDIKEFHQTVLQVGPSPLEIVEAEVDDWIKSSQISTAVQLSSYFSVIMLSLLAFTI